MNSYVIAAFLLFANVQHIRGDSNSLSQFYPRFRDEYIKPYMQLYGGNYFPWKLLDLVPPNGRFSRPSLPNLITYKKIDPMLFKVGIGKKNYEAFDPFLFRIGLGKRRGGEDAEPMVAKTRNRREDVGGSSGKRFGTEQKRIVLLSSGNAVDLNPENTNSFSDLKP